MTYIYIGVYSCIAVIQSVAKDLNEVCRLDLDDSPCLRIALKFLYIHNLSYRLDLCSCTLFIFYKSFSHGKTKNQNALPGSNSR
jgi:hypothetical protein